MWKRLTVTLHQVITVYNDMFDHMDGIMRVWAKKMTPGKEAVYFAGKLTSQKLSKYYAEVTPTMGMHRISVHILDPFCKLQSYRKLDKGMDINPENETWYTTPYEETLLKYVENEYCANIRRMSRTNTAPILDVCQILNPQAYPVTMSSPLQQLQHLVNLPLIPMICPAMMRNS